MLLHVLQKCYSAFYSGFGYILLLWMGWKQIWWEISPCILHAHSWVQVSLLPYLHAAPEKLMLFLMLLKKFLQRKYLRWQEKCLSFRPNLILPICFCKQLLCGCLMPAEEVVLRQVSMH